ncbi:MAG: hypothetical protein ACI8X3_002481 [Saprospiraceae bacterium]|jgi:hypothetical protein
MLTNKSIFVFFLAFIFSFSVAANDAPVKTKIKFYSTTLDLQYDPTMLAKNKHCTSTACVKRFYLKLEESNYQLLLDGLLAYKEDLQLNDWFFYNLVRKAVEHIYKNEKDMFRTSTTWFLLTKAGYDTRLYTAKDKYTFLFVRSEDKVFDASYVKMKGQLYVNLTSLYFGLKTKGIYFEVPKYQPGQLNDKLFSFKIGKLPELPPMTVDKTYKFKLDKEEVVLKVKVDTLGNALLRKFPSTLPMNYIKIPLSETTLVSLKEALQPHLEGKTDAEKISVLVSFTRKAFPYKSDQIRFSVNKPLTADQLMMADTSDSEDRCALLYSLLKETTDLNFILVKYIYNDIITIGVELPEVTGRPFVHEGIEYTICDPTMPSNSSKLGLYPINLDKDIEILEVVKGVRN